MTVGLALGVVFGVQNSSRVGDTLDWENNNSIASGSSIADWSSTEIQSYDEKYILKDGEYSDATTKKAVWLNKVLASSNIGKKVLVTMGEDWVASTAAGGFLDSTSQPCLSIGAGYDITFDLAGHKLDRNAVNANAVGLADARHFNLNGGCSLTINDTVGGGKIINSWAVQGSGSIHINDGSKLTINGGEFSNNHTRDGFGNVIVLRGECIMNGGVIKNNTTIDRCAWGGAVGIGQYTKNGSTIGGTFTMNGGEISNNVGICGAVVIGNLSSGTNAEKGTFIMNGGVIKENKTEFSSSSNNSSIDSEVSFGYWVGGGVALLNKNSSFTMNGGTITGNTAACKGGGVRVSEGTFTMNGGTISNNQSGVKKDGSASGHNNACGGGLNITGSDSKFIMNGGEINENKSKTFAGGMYCGGNAKITLNSGRITGNESQGAGSSGGGIYLDDCGNNVTIKNITVTGNKLPNSPNAIGAGILHNSGTTVSLAGALICKNNRNGTGATNYGIPYTLGAPSGSTPGTNA
ncbi:MAG: hypothetical protein K2J30_04570, partial [Clostridia bacterium]|nr:hypothetical protein [Clostridia bacterium]